MARTDSLPEAHGIQKIIRNLRYHEASRQWFAVLFVLLVSLLGEPHQLPLYIGAGIAAVGTLIRLWASGHVMKNKELATDGPYAFVRHPLYVGNILLLLGFSIASSLWWSYVLMVALLLFYYPPTIAYEDNKLKNFFGEPWEEWSKTTHALIPTWPKRKAGSSEGSSWSFRKSLVQNGEPVIVVYLIGCLYLLYNN
ncbi:MAG: isoprenylcysteine carboxylmethyltransferase family protein [Gammaproteobacteria bacterium]|nr:isoprenylcysteine carboxylmethyltransferase family protein [Gammaproteobacteria bacterium]MCW8922294.1 isoprenylcysteine carboxylmethyltransferase family protein [Gammaproteobacteria bacterium]